MKVTSSNITTDYERPYRMIRRIGKNVFCNGHVYQCKSYHKAKQMFATLANVQNKRRKRYSYVSI
jgi:hypothetical protein